MILKHNFALFTKLMQSTSFQGIVVDVDNSLILQSQQDETTILPVGISRSLKVALQLAQNSTFPEDPSRNVLVSEAFLRTFVEVCGHYQTHIVVQQDGKRVFEVRFHEFCINEFAIEINTVE